MSLRAEPGQNPALSFLTDASMQAADLGFLVSGDYVYSEQSGGYFYLPKSTLALSSTVLATGNSNGGALPGRLVFNGFTPSGPTSAIAVANYAALDALDANGYGQGTTAYMIPQHAKWILRLGAAPAGSSTDEARTALSTVVKYWERESQGSNTWYLERNAAEGSCTINSDTGSDDAVGSSTTPLRTFDEFIRRTNDVSINTFFQVNVLGASFIMTKAYAPLGQERNGEVFITGTWTTIGSSVISAATDFNRATNTLPQYAATVAGNQLTSYVGPYQLGNAAFSQRGWIIGGAGGSNVFSFTYTTSTGTRASIGNGNACAVRQLTTTCTNTVVFNGQNCQIEIDLIYFNNNRTEIIGGPSSNQSFNLELCRMQDVYASGWVYIFDCALTRFRMTGGVPAMDNSVVVGGDMQLVNCGAYGTGTSADATLHAPSFFNTSAVVANSSVAMSDVCFRNNGINLTNDNSVVFFTSFVWGPNAGGTTANFLCAGARSVYEYINAGDLTIQVTGPQNFASVRSANGTLTNAATTAALPLVVAGQFSGFVQ